ncbi:MAG: class III poly(R)-hydroxyalkanoic acid synthase subunit PhaC [Gammaproteobacteria bacterium]|nr:class III poly(R)-hydroxyalkanoic acid synthase subunit PhaC [Gammaproteobacteria bacterium]MDH3464445.1 class III poly(R)-hydroxyalkanoic acid synthase subunit PhaC [Gammaproteobacteria bacterium]
MTASHWIDSATHEFAEFSRKLGSGVTRLAEVKDIDIGPTPKHALYHEDKLTLFHYEWNAQKPRIPLLIVYALVNRPYMADLQTDRSLIRGLLAAGIDVYLIDWGYPDQDDRRIGLGEYVNGYIDRCVDVVRSRHQTDSVNVLGICQGGTLSLCYAALFAGKIKNLITMVTPVDFHTEDNVLSRWLRYIDVDLLVDSLGNVPGELLNWIFLSLKPYRLTSQKYVRMVDILDDAEKLMNFLRMEKWIFDSPDQAGEAFRQFAKDFFQDNKLISGDVSIAGRNVDLRNIKIPLFNIYATQDHLVPPAASTALRAVVGSDDYDELAFEGGHIGIYVSGRAQRQIPKAIASWLAQRDTA